MNVENIITGCILGAKGSGKSVFLAYLLSTAKKRTVLFDMLGVFNPKSKHKTAVIPNSYYCLSPDDFIACIDKFPKNAKVVIDFSGLYSDELIYKIDEVSKILLSEGEWGVFSDEVADFMPLHSGSREFHQLVKNGRNYGIKPVIFATQRPQSANKNIFDLCECFFISQQKAPRTIEYILEIIDRKGDTETGSMIRKLEQREFLIYDGDLRLYKVPFYKYSFKQ
jgi:hypothetical protein